MTEQSVDFEKIGCIYAENEEKFRIFQNLLLEYNARYNLTAITEPRELLIKHFYDSLAGEFLFEKNANVIEIGSGAGFPSLPLKIARGDLRFTLVESTGKKCEFLKTAVKECGLENVEVLCVRAEELGKNSAYREKFDICCARAVAQLNTLAEYCLPFVKTGGKFVAYKGRAEEEIERAKRAVSTLGGGKTQNIRYELPDGMGARSLVVVSKEKPTPLSYPRGNGKERKNPL